MLNITNIPAPRVPFLDERTGLMSREWYRFFLNLFVLTGSGSNPTTLDELQLGPPNPQDLTELLIQINQNVAPQYEDQSGDFLKTLDTAQLMSMMSQFANAEAAIQGAYLQPVVQTGTIANYNLDGSPTAGGIAYGTGPALAVSVAGTLGQVLTSGGAGAPTWATDGGGTVTSVSVVSANGLAGTVATATTTPAITLSTTVTGLLKGNGTAISAATSGTDYAPATSGTSILYGNGAGGFSNVTIGTGVAFSAGTLSATGSGGTVTSVAALTLGTTGTDLSSTVANGTTTPVITLQVPTASAANRGALSAADWTTFNNKGSGTVTSVAQSFTGGLISVAGSPITTSGTLALTVAGTSGGVPYFSSASTWATSAALTASALIVGGGAGAAPATTTTGTGVVTALGVNTGTAGAFVVNGSALGTPSSGTATNLTGLPLTTGVTGILPVANGGTGLASIAHTVQVFTSGSGTYTTPANVKAIWVRAVGGGGGAGGTGSAGAPTNGTGGGNTTFSTLTATAGSGGPNSLTGGFLGGAAGGASGGDINQSGSPGDTSIGNSSPAVFQGYGMNGGASVLGGGGRAGTNGAGATGGAATANSGGGGGGVGGNALVYASAGGGAGGYVEKLIAAPSATYSYAVGAGGAGGAAGTGGGTGGAGGSGVIIVTEYYV